YAIKLHRILNPGPAYEVVAAQDSRREIHEEHHPKGFGGRVALEWDQPDGRDYGRAGRGAIRDGIRPADAHGSRTSCDGCQHREIRRRNELDAVDYDDAHRPDDVGR